jgi:hypothetical protein
VMRYYPAKGAPPRRKMASKRPKFPGGLYPIGRPKPAGGGMTRPLPPQTGKRQSGTKLNQSQAIQQLAKVLVQKKATRKGYRPKESAWGRKPKPMKPIKGRATLR